MLVAFILVPPCDEIHSFGGFQQARCHTTREPNPLLGPHYPTLLVTPATGLPIGIQDNAHTRTLCQ